ncbi:MAG: ribosomal protein S18-alanine N-acetyltransferase [Candidatus Hydrothermarchaeota archaeon]
MKIRSMSHSDFDRVIEIERASFKDPWSHISFLDLFHFSPKGFIVVEVQGEIVGYAIYVLETNEIGHLLSIAVDPNWRRKKIGTSLMNYIIEDLRNKGVKYLKLEVREGNLPAIKLYKSLGFLEIEIIRYYYSDGENAILMVKDISRE